MALVGAPDDVVAELDRLEADNPGCQVEYLDGEFVVNQPRTRHGMAKVSLARTLGPQVDKLDGWELTLNVRVVVSGLETSWIVPDLCVVPTSAAEKHTLPIEDLLLMVEVLSPSTRTTDLGPKRAFCEQARIDYFVYEAGGPTLVGDYRYGQGLITP